MRPFGLAVDSVGSLYVADEAGDAVRRYAASTGVAIGDFIGPRSGGLVGPDRLVFGPDGALYVSSAGGSSVLRFSGTSGVFDREFVETGAGGLDGPSGLIFSPEGDLFVSSFGGNSVIRYAGFVVNTARIAADSPIDPKPENDTRSAALAIRADDAAAAADLRLSMEIEGVVDDPAEPGGVTSSPTHVTAGRGLNANLTIANAGPGGAANARVMISLPIGIDLLAGNVFPGGTGTCRGVESPEPLLFRLVQCDLGMLVVGGEVRVAMTTMIDPALPAGESRTIDVNVMADAAESMPEDNRASRTIEVEARSDLSAYIDVVGGAPLAALVGSPIDITLRVHNLGPSMAPSAIVSMIIPAGLSLTQIPSDGIDCDLPAWGALRCHLVDFIPGPAEEFSLGFLLADGLPGRELRATSEVFAPEGMDLYPENDAVEASIIQVVAGEGSEANVLIETHIADRPNPGLFGDVTFRVRLRNDGPGEARGVHVVHRLPPGVKYIGHDTEFGVFEPGLLSGRWSPGPIPDGGSVEIDLETQLNGETSPLWPAGTGMPRGVLGAGDGLGTTGKLTLGPDGDIYLASGLGAVHRFDGLNGVERGVFVPAGGALRFASAVAWGPGGDLYVADAVADAVRRYDGVNGAEMPVFVSPGDGGLTTPSDLAWGPDGDLYVADQLGSRILRYDGSTGAFRDAVVPEARGGLSVPSSIAFGPQGDLWVASFGSGEVLRFATDSGELIGRIATDSAGLERPSAIRFGFLGDLLAAGEAAGTVWRFGLDGEPLGAYVDEGDDAAGVIGLEFGLDGHLLVSDTRRRQVGRYDGFALAWASLAVHEGVDTDMTDNRVAAAIILPTSTAPLPSPSPSATSAATATPGGATPVPPLMEPIILPMVANR